MPTVSGVWFLAKIFELEGGMINDSLLCWEKNKDASKKLQAQSIPSSGHHLSMVLTKTTSETTRGQRRLQATNAAVWTLATVVMSSPVSDLPMFNLFHADPHMAVDVISASFHILTAASPTQHTDWKPGGLDSTVRPLQPGPGTLLISIKMKIYGTQRPLCQAGSSSRSSSCLHPATQLGRAPRQNNNIRTGPRSPQG